MSLDGSPAVHQSTHLGHEDLSFLSGSDSFMGFLAEPLPLGRPGDFLVEPFASVCDTIELGEQLLLAHLIQAGQRRTVPIGTESPANSMGQGL
jgi:hypothetical protein